MFQKEQAEHLLEIIYKKHSALYKKTEASKKICMKKNI